MSVSNRKFGIVAALGLAAAGVLGLAPAANATSIEYNFSNNIGNNTSVTGEEFTMTVNDLGGSMVSFVFGNNGPAGSAITGIYFYDGVILGATGVIDDSATTGSFSENTGSPQNLPGGNGYGLTNATKEFFSHAPGNDGVGVGETLTITMEISGSFQDLLDAIDAGLGISQSNPFSAGHLVVGLHVQSLPGSDQFLNSGPSSSTVVVPLPAPVWMGLVGLLGVAAIRRRCN